MLRGFIIKESDIKDYIRFYKRVIEVTTDSINQKTIKVKVASLIPLSKKQITEIKEAKPISIQFIIENVSLIDIKWKRNIIV